MANETGSLLAPVNIVPKTYSCPLCGQRILDKEKYQQVLRKMRSEAELQARNMLEEEREKHNAAVHALKDRLAKEFEGRLNKEKSSLGKEIKRAIRKRERELNRLSQRNGRLLQRVEQLEKRKAQAYDKGLKDAELKGHKQTIELQQKIDELHRKLEKQTSAERGDVSEEKILTTLQQTFKADEFERIQKGESGADILQKVMQRGEPVGKIVYEAKDVQSWSNGFITKALTYKDRYQTPHAIIVTNAFPQGERFYAIRTGIHLVHPRLVGYIAGVIRSGIVELASSRLSEQGKDEKMSKLYDYLRSQDFKQKVEALFISETALEDLLKKEKEEHQRRWGKQTEEYDKLRQNLVAIDEKIRSLIEG